MTFPLYSPEFINWLWLLGASSLCVGFALGLLLVLCVKRWDGDT